MTDDPGQPSFLASILVSDRQRAAVDVDALVALARRTLRGEGLHHVELSVSFVEDAEMEELHVRYMDEAGPTDVLSFPQDADGNGEEHAGPRILGDVVIAPAVAARNHPDDPAAELRLLLVHGILHLLGHDHEAPEERAAMWARQERYSGVRTP
jgi:probable rRNA maturation factor